MYNIDYEEADKQLSIGIEGPDLTMLREEADIAAAEHGADRDQTPEELEEWKDTWMKDQITRNRMAKKQRQAATGLIELAEGCIAGACNIAGLLNSLSKCYSVIPPGEMAAHPAVRVILSHLSMLAGQSGGVSFEAERDFEIWKNLQ